MSRLNQEFYARPASEVARDILGRTLVYRLPTGRIVRAILTEVGAYEGEEKTTSKGASYAPGLVSISTKFGQRLFDIATGKSGRPSCITLRGAVLEDRVERIEGPGKLTEALGINSKNSGSLDAESVYGKKVWVEGNSATSDKIKKLKGNSPNCKGIFRLTW